MPRADPPSDALVHRPVPTFKPRQRLVDRLLPRDADPQDAWPDPHVLPTFLVLGAAKCATTSLYYYLRQHPDVFMADPKEPFFFEAEYEKGLGYYAHTYFAGHAGERAVGECRHRNLFLPFVAPRIRAALPDARFIVVVRDPVERAYSEWWHGHSRGREPLSFEDALQHNRRRLRDGPWFRTERGARAWADGLDPDGITPYRTYIDGGHYARQLQRYIRLFGRDRVKVVLFDDLVWHKQATMDDVFRSIGVRPFRVPDLSPTNGARPEHASISPRGLAWRRRINRVPVPYPWRLALRARVEPRFRVAKPPMRRETRRELAKHYAPHNEELEKLMGRDLAHWAAA